MKFIPKLEKLLLMNHHLGLCSYLHLGNAFIFCKFGFIVVDCCKPTHPIRIIIHCMEPTLIWHLLKCYYILQKLKQSKLFSHINWIKTRIKLVLFELNVSFGFSQMTLSYPLLCQKRKLNWFKNDRNQTVPKLGSSQSKSRQFFIDSGVIL